MKNKSYIDFHSTNMFKAIFSFICLFIIMFLILVMIRGFIKNAYLAYTITYTLLTIYIFIKERKYLCKSMKSIKKDFKDNCKNLVTVICILFILEYLFNALFIHILGHEPNNNAILVESFNGNNIIIILYYVLIIGPILEELIFAYPYSEVNNRTIAYIFYSILFALFHVMSSSTLLDLLFIIPYLCMSFAFGYGFYKTNNIFLSIITHSINNLIAFVLLFIL